MLPVPYRLTADPFQWFFWQKPSQNNGKENTA